MLTELGIYGYFYCNFQIKKLFIYILLGKFYLGLLILIGLAQKY